MIRIHNSISIKIPFPLKPVIFDRAAWSSCNQNSERNELLLYSMCTYNTYTYMNENTFCDIQKCWEQAKWRWWLLICCFQTDFIRHPDTVVKMEKSSHEFIRMYSRPNVFHMDLIYPWPDSIEHAEPLMLHGYTHDHNNQAMFQWETQRKRAT